MSQLLLLTGGVKATEQGDIALALARTIRD